MAVFCYTVSDAPRGDSMTPDQNGEFISVSCSSGKNLTFCMCHGKLEWDSPYIANHQVFKHLHCRTYRSDVSRVLVIVYCKQHLVALDSSLFFVIRS